MPVVSNKLTFDILVSEATPPFLTAQLFGVEEIIDPREIRPIPCQWIEDAYRLLPSELGSRRRGMKP